MRRRDFFGFALAASCLSPAAIAQQPAKTWRIGNVQFGGVIGRTPLLPLVRHHLARLGHVDGRDIILIDRALQNQPDEAEEALRQLV